jgi:hypothetical protein
MGFGQAVLAVINADVTIDEEKAQRLTTSGDALSRIQIPQSLRNYGLSEGYVRRSEL